MLAAPESLLLEEIRDFCRLWGHTAGRALASSVQASKKFRKAQMAKAANPGVGKCSVAFTSCPSCRHAR